MSAYESGGAVGQPPYTGTPKYVPQQVETTTTGTSTSSHTRTTYRTSKTQDTVLHELTDDKASGGFGSFGTANYAGKSITVRLVSLDATTEGYKSDYEKAESFENKVGTSTTGTGSNTGKGGEYGDSAVTEELLAASTVILTYAKDFASPQSNTVSVSPGRVTVDLCPLTADYIVPGSVRFTWMTHVFEDYEGTLVRDRTPSNVGYDAGQINYATGIADITDYVVNGSPTNFVLNSLWTIKQKWTTGSIFMRTQTAPIKPTGFVMNLSDTAGNAITAMADNNGNIDGDHLRGKINYETGVVELQFGDFVLDTSLTAEEKAEWWYSAADVGAVQALKIWKPHPVDPTTLRYNSVSYFYLPLDATILGIDPVRLPPDGRVAIFRPGGFAVVGHTGVLGPQTVSNGQTLNCGRVRLSRVRITDSASAVINTGYTEDLEAGTVTFTNVAGYAQPITIEHRIEDMVQVSDVQINGQLGFTRQLTHAFPVPGSYVSSALVAGDLKSRVSVIFDQATWDTVSWSDALIGNTATGTYNDVLAPIAVTNYGATSERWIVRFLTTTTFQVIGEHVGVITTGDINTNCAPLNPATSQPYFTLAALGWGSGWAVGNILRFNTVGALFPLWLVRTVQQGPEAGVDYRFSLLIRGDVDAP